MSLRISQASNLFTVNVFLMDTTPRAHQIFGGHVVLQGCHNALPLEIRVETRQKKLKSTVITRISTPLLSALT
jgi:hypothetical protein